MAIGTTLAIGLGAGAITAGTVGSAMMGASAARKAGRQQYEATMAGVAEQKAAREQLRADLAPYTAAGGPALNAQLSALGLAGPEAQQEFVRQQEASPFFQALAKQGEEGMLQNAAATGGLRGGNLQGALAQFRPALLNQFLEQQYNRLGGMTALGQQSAAGVGAAGMQSASNIANLLMEGGAAQAGATLGAGKAWSQPFNALSTIGGLALSKKLGF